MSQFNTKKKWSTLTTKGEVSLKALKAGNIRYATDGKGSSATMFASKAGFKIKLKRRGVNKELSFSSLKICRSFFEGLKIEWQLEERGRVE
jgi:hypothetical protein